MRYAHRAPLTRGQVRCCSDATDDEAPANTGWRKVSLGASTGMDPKLPLSDCSVWAGSDADWECAKEKTFAEAEAICKAAGARLCTDVELEAGCTIGTGCSLDTELVWGVRTPSPPPAPPVGL
mgnify:CR=1 FL=1